ncbi:DUF6427 family protein [Mariniflexile ostreae]|uniref:DUF6427 family protein n=1 Tax=Mariniflexile ostreae TaxID=1520892 RepID=A0ABV5F706_9FLAO
MITSLFSKSKPLNFIIVFFILVLAFALGNKHNVDETKLLEKVVLFLVCVVSVLIINFIVSKNNLTQNSNYEILFFSLFLLALPNTTTNGHILISNIFLLLGIRRLITMRSQIDVQKKIFDAAFWIAIACLFYFWAILFFVLILIALLLYSDNNIKHWLIPFVGAATVFLITVSVSVIWYDDFFTILNIDASVSYDFSNYNSVQYLITTTMLFSFGIWSSIFYLKSINQKKKAVRPPFKVVLFTAFISFFVIILAPKKDGSEFLFMLAPVAVIIANYIETIQEKWFKELFLGILMFVPFILLML